MPFFFIAESDDSRFGLKYLSKCISTMSPGWMPPGRCQLTVPVIAYSSQNTLALMPQDAAAFSVFALVRPYGARMMIGARPYSLVSVAREPQISCTCWA